MDDQDLTLEEVSAYFKIPKATLYHLAQSGRIPASKIGNMWRFRKAQLDEWFRLNSNALRSYDKT